METLVWTGELNQVTGTIHMCMAVLFYTHQHLSSASVIRMLFPVSSGDLFYSSCASICLHKSLIFPVIQFVLVNIILFLISPQFILVSDVFPTSPQFVFDFFFFIPNDTCYWWRSFVLSNTFVVMVNCILKEWTGRMSPWRIKILLQ